MVSESEVRVNYYLNLTFRFFVIVLLLMIVSDLVNNPEAIGEFFGKIVKSFKAAK